MTQAENKNLAIAPIFQEVFGLLGKNFTSLLLIYFLGLAFNLVLVLLIIAIAIFLVPLFIFIFQQIHLFWSIFPIVILGGILWVMVFLVVFWVQGVYFEAAKTLLDKQKLEVWPPFEQSFKKIRLYFSANFLAGLVIVLGFIFLIVPGVWLAIRLFLVNVIVAAEGKGGLAAFKRSFALTKGFDLLILVVFLIFFGILLVASAVPLVGWILSGLGSILAALVQAIVYHQIKNKN